MADCVSPRLERQIVYGSVVVCIIDVVLIICVIPCECNNFQTLEF